MFAQELEAAGITEADDVRASLTAKLQGATTASQIALAWMLIRERIRAWQHPGQHPVFAVSTFIYRKGSQKNANPRFQTIVF